VGCRQALSATHVVASTFTQQEFPVSHLAATARVARWSAAIVTGASILSTPAVAQRACARSGGCVAVPAFEAAVTDFRLSPGQYGGRLITATVRFTNRTDRPLTLGYVTGSGVSLDDQGNRHVVYGDGAVRGIGEIRAGSFDPKFTLRPGESSDARFELVFRPQTRGQVLGTTFDLDLAVRQIDPLAGGQWRLGREHSLHFEGFGSGRGMASGLAGGASSGGEVTSASGGAMTAPAPAPEVADAAPSTDACAGRDRCYDAGTFVAEVGNFTAGVEGRHHVLRSVVRIRNRSAVPIILAYKPSTSGATDNLGNRYYWGRSGTYDTSVQGIGLVQRGSADPQFSLAPGQSRDARFTQIRYEVGNKQLGTAFDQEFSVVLLEPLPSGQIRAGREFAVTLHGVAPGAGAGNAAGNAAVNAAARKLFDAIRGGKKH
jgi:hypothetical protein